MAEDVKPGSVFLKAPLICLPVSFIEAAGLGVHRSLGCSLASSSHRVNAAAHGTAPPPRCSADGKISSADYIRAAMDLHCGAVYL